MTATNTVDSESLKAGRANAAMPVAIAAAIMLIAAVLAPIALGYRYRPLPMALWGFGARTLIAGSVRVDGKFKSVESGRVVECGFFSLEKTVPVDWRRLESGSR